MSQPALSQHLAVLRRADLVTQRRDGRRRLYRVNPEPLREIVDWVEHYRRFWDDKLAALGDYLDVQAGSETERAPEPPADQNLRRAARPRAGRERGS
jgi:hypothetical protein